MLRPDPAARRTVVVRPGAPWPDRPLELGDVLLCPDGRRVRVDALSGRRDEDGGFVHVVLITAVDEPAG